MTHYSDEILGYAVALFTCYGVFVGDGLSWVGWCPLFLLLGLAVAVGVIARESIWSDVLPSVIHVAHYCTLGFALGWCGFHVLLWTGLPAALFGAGMR